MEGEYEDEGEEDEDEEDDGEGQEEEFDGLEDMPGQLDPDDVVFVSASSVCFSQTLGSPAVDLPGCATSDLSMQGKLCSMGKAVGFAGPICLVHANTLQLIESGDSFGVLCQCGFTLTDTMLIRFSTQEGEEIGLPMWPGAGEDGLFPDDDNLPPMPRWLNVNLPRVNGAAGGPGIGRLGGAMGMVGDAALGGPRQAVEVRCLTYLPPLVCSKPPSDEMPGMQLPSKLQSVG